MHPRLPLTKHFFFPGFTGRTGGLLVERELAAQRAAFGAAEAAAFLAHLGVAPAEQAALKVSLFCYPSAPVAELFATWAAAGDAVTCLVPQGVADGAVRQFLGAEPQPGAVRTHGALSVRVIPFVPQPDYDKLLWSCDLNFVRGEDSWVRAQWACKPFVWHIYFQDENLHHKKLRAFLQRYAAGNSSLPDFSLAWNGASESHDWQTLWPALMADLPALAQRAVDWQQQMRSHGDLATNLLEFARSLQYD
jgi:uncharacterized repeat protein (TIGR03837 family)